MSSSIPSQAPTTPDSRVARCLRRVGDALEAPPPRSSRDPLAVRVRRLMVDLDAADARWAARHPRP